MSNPTPVPLVRQAVHLWLTERFRLLNSIMEEVATEVAPLIAGQVLNHLQASLIETPDQKLLHNLARACKEALTFIDAVGDEFEDPDIAARFHVRLMVADVLQVYLLKYGESFLSDKPAVSAERTPFDGLEGGEA